MNDIMKFLHSTDISAFTLYQACLSLCDLGDVLHKISEPKFWRSYAAHSDLPREGVIFNIPTFLCHAALHVIVKIATNNKVFFCSLSHHTGALKSSHFFSFGSGFTTND